jgi:hypothetical protein
VLPPPSILAQPSDAFAMHNGDAANNIVTTTATLLSMHIEIFMSLFLFYFNFFKILFV